VYIFNDLCAGTSQRNVFKKPIIVYAYPKDFKAFYMGLNDDGKACGSHGAGC
jgi:aspartyl/asparaginyl-tRNA synthetase